MQNILQSLLFNFFLTSSAKKILVLQKCEALIFNFLKLMIISLEYYKDGKCA